MTVTKKNSWWYSYDFLRVKSELHARTPRSAELALAFSEAWSSTIIDFLMKINNLYKINSYSGYEPVFDTFALKQASEEAVKAVEQGKK